VIVGWKGLGIALRIEDLDDFGWKFLFLRTSLTKREVFRVKNFYFHFSKQKVIDKI
jgi:hypothetical protein